MSPVGSRQQSRYIVPKSCIYGQSVPEDGRNCRPKQLEQAEKIQYNTFCCMLLVADILVLVMQGQTNAKQIIRNNKQIQGNALILYLYKVNILKFQTHDHVHRNSMLIKIQPDATVCRYLLTAKSLYMFRVSQHPSSGVLKLKATLEGSSCTIIMTCAGGCGYSF